MSHIEQIPHHSDYSNTLPSILYLEGIPDALAIPASFLCGFPHVRFHHITICLHDRLLSYVQYTPRFEQS